MTIKLINKVYIADTARVTGLVTLNPNVNLWYSVSIRGDVAPITIGQNTNVQDNSTIHCDYDIPNIIGPNVSIAHGAIIHGSSVAAGSLIGMGARLLSNTKIGKSCLIAAGTVVPPNMEIPDNMVAMGIPAKIIRPTTDKEKTYLADLPTKYIELARQYTSNPNHPNTRTWHTNP